MPIVQQDWRFEDWELAGLKEFSRCANTPKQHARDWQLIARQAMLMALMFPAALQRELAAYKRYCDAEGIAWDMTAVVNKVKARKTR